VEENWIKKVPKLGVTGWWTYYYDTKNRLNAVGIRHLPNGVHHPFPVACYRAAPHAHLTEWENIAGSILPDDVVGVPEIQVTPNGVDMMVNYKKTRPQQLFLSFHEPGKVLTREHNHILQHTADGKVWVAPSELACSNEHGLYVADDRRMRFFPNKYRHMPVAMEF
jgi:hypothetical protein